MIYLISGPQGRTDSATQQPSEAQRLSEFIPDDPLRAEGLPHPNGIASRPSFYPLRLIALGYPQAVDNCRLRLHQLGYADPNEWSIALPIIRSTEVIRAAAPGEIMRILTKRIPYR